MYFSPIDKKIFRFILDKINLEFPSKRKSKYSNSYYLQKIIFILKSGCSFREATCDHHKRNHYSTVYKKFQNWLNKGIFDNLYEELIKKYKNKFYKHQKKSNILILFIDSTNIRNKNGKELIGSNYQDKYKNGTKITTICDQNKFPLTMDVIEANIHDSKRIHKSLDLLETGIGKTYEIFLVGDKGYIVNDTAKKVLLKRKVKLVHPYRKNQKRTNTKYEKRILKDRHNVENLFAILKQNKKIQQRYEATKKSFTGFIKLAYIYIGYRILLKES